MCRYGIRLLACSSDALFNYALPPDTKWWLCKEGRLCFLFIDILLSLPLKRWDSIQSENNVQSHNCVCFLLLCGIQILKCLSWNSSALVDVVICGYCGVWSLSVGFDIVHIPEVHSKQCVQSLLYNNTVSNNEQEERLICMVTHPHTLAFF